MDVIDEAARTGDSENRSPASLVFVAIALLAVVAAAWWLNFPSSTSPHAGSYIDKDKHFSLVPPSDWMLVNPANYNAFINEYRGRFPAQLQKFLSAPGFSVGFFKIQDKDGQLPPSINVIAIPLKQPMPPLNEQEKDEATKAITKEISKQIESYKLVSSEIVKVDKQAALQLTSTASIRVVLSPRTTIMSEPTSSNTRYITGYTEEVARDMEINSIQTLLPARDWAFILSCNFDSIDTVSAHSTCETALNSFRGGKRPPRFGSVAMWSLNGALVGVFAYLLYVLMGRAWSRS